MNTITLLRYKGYVATPLLCESSFPFPWLQFPIEQSNYSFNKNLVTYNTRLGKLVEEFVFFQLKQHNSVHWILDNLQIQSGKQTIGELDALFFYNEKPIHLEIVYKFYLYDVLHKSDDPLSYWIGPNRKDSLIQKLRKLEHQQFPMLYKDEAKEQLQSYKINIDDIEQRLFFKAQLFLPYNVNNIDIQPLNKFCVSGFYVSFNKLIHLKKSQFYIPEKLDWLIIPHTNVIWWSYEDARRKIKCSIDKQLSPLIWVKHNNSLEKGFVTWW